MKYLGILNTLVIIDAESRKEARKKQEQLCNDISLNSSNDHIFCVKPSKHLTKVNLADGILSSNSKNEKSRITLNEQIGPGFANWMERSVNIGSPNKDWFCSSCGCAANKMKTKYCPNCGSRMFN